jgi:hypothetical protein
MGIILQSIYYSIVLNSDTHTRPVSKEMTRHLETFLRDYNISSPKLFKVR